MKKYTLAKESKFKYKKYFLLSINIVIGASFFKKRALATVKVVLGVVEKRKISKTSRRG
jgi:hypothetical protein